MILTGDVMTAAFSGSLTGVPREQLQYAEAEQVNQPTCSSTFHCGFHLMAMVV